MDDELYHHGVLGMKWGVRRYQNKDGTLTYAGKKRAVKMQNQYTEFSKKKQYRDEKGNLTYAGRKKELKMKEEYSRLTGGKQLRKFPNSGNNQGISDAKTKSIKEMSNKEIQDKIDRIRLENTLKSLTPKETTRGERFVSGLKDSAVSIIKDKGTKIAGDYVEKKLRDKLGISKKETRTATQILKDEADKYKARTQIDQGQRYFQEGRYARNDQSQNETGRGGSNRTVRRNTDTRGNVVNAEWREANNDDINSGRDFVEEALNNRRNGG